MKRILTIALFAVLCVLMPVASVSCSIVVPSVDNGGSDPKENPEPEPEPEPNPDPDPDPEPDPDPDSDEFTRVIDLVWNGSQVSVTNSSKLSVSSNGGHVVVGAAGAEGNKVRINLSGTSSDGSLKIYNGVKANDTHKKIMLCFNGVKLTSSKGPAINIQGSKTVYVVLSDGTSNSLCDATTYSGIPDGEDAKGCFFSEEQLVFSGKGSLTVEGRYKHAICADDYIEVTDGNIRCVVSATAGKCLKSNKDVFVSGGTLDLSTSGGGTYDATDRDTSTAACIKADNDISLSGGKITCKSTGAGGKGLNAGHDFIASGDVDLTVSTSGATYSYSNNKSYPKGIKAENLVKIDGGSIDVTTTGSGGEGIESKASIEVNGGRIVLNTKDDGMNAATTITFNGGYTYVYASGNDGIDSNYGRANAIVVNGGVVMSHSAASPEEGFDADNHAYLTFNGGYVLCTGGQQGGGGGGGRPGPGGGGTGSGPSCKQSTFMWTAAASKGYFTITDAAGKVVMSCYVPRALSSSYTMVSAPLSAGTSYKCGFTASAPSGTTPVFDTYFYDSGTLTGLSKTFTATSGYTTL